MGDDGTVDVGAADGAVYGIQGRSGLADGPWPKFRANAQNTGRVLPLPLRLEIDWSESKVCVVWTGQAILQSSDTLTPGSWQDLSEATSPHEANGSNPHRYYRLRRP